MVERLLLDAACRLNIFYQPDPSGTTLANDGRVIQTANSGVAVASVGIPQRNMHTQVEIVSRQDLEDSVKLLVEFVTSMDAETDFRPFHLKTA